MRHLQRLAAGQVRKRGDPPGDTHQHSCDVRCRECGRSSYNRRLGKMDPGGLPRTGPAGLQQCYLRALSLECQRRRLDEEIEGTADHEGEDRQNRAADGHGAYVEFVQEQWQEGISDD